MSKHRVSTFVCFTALFAAGAINVVACSGQHHGDGDSSSGGGTAVGEAESELIISGLGDPCITIRRGSNEGSVVDAYADPSFPNTNFGGAPVIEAGATKNGFFEFNLASGVIPPGSIIKTAEFVFVPAEDPDTGTFNVYKVNGPWLENGLTHDNQPSYNPFNLVAKQVPYSGMHTYRVDLTKQAIDWYQKGLPNFGIMIRGGDKLNIASSEYPDTSRTPYLRVCYSSPCAGVADGTICNQDAACRAHGVCQGGVCVNGKPAAAGTVCRPSGGPCDVAEVCDGTTFECPAPALAPTTKVCREAAGLCDVAETCDGASRACPANQIKPIGTVCREAAVNDLCDAVETCDGRSYDCPEDGVKTEGTACREVKEGDLCDVTEHCDGKSKDCPPDGFKSAGTECRPKNGACDVAEECTGNSPTCPGDVIKAAGTECLAPASNLCQLDGVCDGSSTSCPNPSKPDGTSCGTNAFCSGGSCVSCGDFGEPCCSGGTCPGSTTNLPLMCGGNNHCISCGILNSPCCPGSYCGQHPSDPTRWLKCDNNNMCQP